LKKLKRKGTSEVIENKKQIEELKTRQLKSEIEEAYLDERKRKSETMMKH
jgi:hypothetical protein